jgi:hypothetical protein
MEPLAQINKLEQSLSEELAGLLISASLGSDYSYVHTGDDTSLADCELHKSGEIIGQIEVTADRDGNYERLLKEVLNEPKAERLDLPIDFGTWSCELERHARMRNLDFNAMRDLIGMAITLGLDDLDVRDQWPRGELLDRLSLLGIRSLHCITRRSGESFVFRHLPSEGGMIDNSVDLLASYSSSILARPRTLEKLRLLDERSPGLTRHFCVIVGSGSDYSVRFRMSEMGLVGPCPSKPIELPVELDSFWVMSQSAGRVLGFRRKTGWLEYTRPSLGSPWWNFENLQKVNEVKAASDMFFKMRRNRNRPNE